MKNELFIIQSEAQYTPAQAFVRPGVYCRLGGGSDYLVVLSDGGTNGNHRAFYVSESMFRLSTLADWDGVSSMTEIITNKWPVMHIHQPDIATLTWNEMLAKPGIYACFDADYQEERFIVMHQPPSAPAVLLREATGFFQLASTSQWGDCHFHACPDETIDHIALTI